MVDAVCIATDFLQKQDNQKCHAVIDVSQMKPARIGNLAVHEHEGCLMVHYDVLHFQTPTTDHNGVSRLITAIVGSRGIAYSWLRQQTLIG